MNPRCCQAVANRGSVSITAGSACSDTTVASSVTSSRPRCSRASQSSDANTVTSSAAPTSVGVGRTEIRPSPPIRSRSRSPRPDAGTQYRTSAAVSRQPSTTPSRVGRSRSHQVASPADGSVGPPASRTDSDTPPSRASPCAPRSRTNPARLFSRTPSDAPPSRTPSGPSAVSPAVGSNGASTSASDGPSDVSEPGSRDSTGRPTSTRGAGSWRGALSAQVGRWSGRGSAGRSGRLTDGVPVDGVPGPGRTSGRRS